MKMSLEKLVIVYFKGIKQLEVPFHHITNIFGENAAGKTTVFDAFTWLFFGKDSTDRKDFDIKPLDNNGISIPKTDVEVSAIIKVDGKPIEIKKVLKEKWVKKRGELITEFTGNENLYFWNDVPLQLKSFQDKINDLLKENVFKLITNPLYFNSLKWQERRSILEVIGGEITDNELMEANPSFKELIKRMDGKSLKDFKAMILSQKKKLKDELQAIPTRIDEINRFTPKVVNYDSLRSQLADKLKRISEIDDQLQDSTKVMESAYTAKRDQQNRLHEFKTTASNIKNEVRTKFATDANNMKHSIAENEAVIASTNKSISTKKEYVDSLTKEIDKLKTQKAGAIETWEAYQQETLVFDEANFNCPACKRPLDANDINSNKEIQISNFNTSKASKIQSIEEKGSEINKRIATCTKSISELEIEIASLTEKIKPIEIELISAKENYNKYLLNAESEFNLLLEENVDYKASIHKIAAMELIVSQPIKEADNTSLKSIKQAINEEADLIKKQLNDEETIKKNKDRVKELQTQESLYAQQLANLEGSEYLAEQYNKAKMETLVAKINGRFKYVSFKMFESQINGGETECCETMVMSDNNSLVPFSNANNAARINAGLDIINTLCEHYNVFAPIFVDNRESINNLIECESQVVNLIVSTDKKLRVA